MPLPVELVIAREAAILFGKVLFMCPYVPLLGLSVD
jgi:hypothetical protein